MKTTILITALLAAAGLAQSAEPSRFNSPTLGCEAGFSLTKDNLGPILASLGFRPEKVNEKRYRMPIERGGLKYTIAAAISDDATEVWLSTYVAQVADIATVPVSVLDKLMITSYNFGPSHFAFVAGEKPGTRKLYLHRALDNRGLNPAMVREAIDKLAADVVDTKALWEAAGR